MLMHRIYAGLIALLLVVAGLFCAGPAHAYKDVTRSQALAGCEDTLAHRRNDTPAGWVFHGSCRPGEYTQAQDPANPMYLGCYEPWGNYDLPAAGVYGEEYAINEWCFGREDDSSGANAGASGGCDGGEGGCHGIVDRGQPIAGDPINTATGNKFLEEADYSDDPTLRFRRFYSSDPSTESTAMGTRWSHSFSRKLERFKYWNGTSSIGVNRPTGLHELFRKELGATSWSTSPDNADKLTENVDAQGETVGYTLWIAALRHTETYSASGLLLTVTDETGQTVTLTYSDTSTPRATAPSPDLLLNVTAPNGRQLSFSYDGNAHVHQVVLPDGGTISYGYDVSGNLTSVTHADGHARQYVYNEPAMTGGASLVYAMTGLIDENGVRLESTTYDSGGRATSTGAPSGAGKVSVNYNSDGTSDVTYPLGSVSHQSYVNVQQHLRVATLDKACGECGQPYASRTYDSNSRPASYTDFNGSVRAVTYDANGLLTQEIEAQGSGDQRTTNTEWDIALRTPLARTVKDAGGNVVQRSAWAYNSRGQTTAACLIDPVVAPTFTCSASGASTAGVRRVVMTYCDAVSATCPLMGLLLQVDGPRTDVNDTIRYAWYPTTDESGCSSLGGACHRAGDLASVTDGAGLVTTYLTYDKAGRPTRVKGPGGVLTDYTYTPRGWLSTTSVRALIDGTPSAADAAIRIDYNPDGTVHQVSDSDGVAQIYTYDAVHRLTDVTDGAGNRQHFTLDASGNRTKEETFTVAGMSVKSTSRTFNSLGQLTSITDGLGRAVLSAADANSYDGNGNLVFSRDGLGYQQKQIFDGLDRLVSTIRNYQGADPATKDTQSVIAYDSVDRVTGFSDPDGLNTTYDINGLGNGQATHSPDTGQTARTFDIAGNVVTSTDALNNTRTMTYDADNRLRTLSFADTSLNVEYKYDEADTVTGCTGNHGAGRATRILEANGGITWCYDGRGNVVSKRQTVGTDTRVTTYTWTLGNRLASVTTPNGTLVNYSRDNLGRITTVTATPAGGTALAVAHDVAYTAFGPIASLTLGDGQTVGYTYDANGALTDIASSAFTLHMKRDAMGNLTALGDAPGVPVATETYGYDPLYRLAGVNDASGTAIEAYTYNKTGDRLSKTGAGVLTGSYGYASGTHHLATVGTTSRVIDARGDTTSSDMASGAWNYIYNQRNRMTAVQKDGATVGTYVLNALGQRVQKTVGAAATRFDYDERSTLLSEATGTTARDYIWLDNMPVGLVDRTGTTASVAFVHADGLGSPRTVTNAAGSVMWQWPYSGNPFGEAAPVSTNGYALNVRFPGQYYDVESGLNYNVNRDYEAATGRYIQSDPVGLKGGVSTYLYVNADPLDYMDAFGLCPDDGESGRYAACNASQDPNSSWLSNKAKMWGCKKVVDATCNSAEGSSTCCEADYNGCTGGKVLGEPPGDAREAKTMGECIAKFQKCMSSGGRGG
jgi:RHS repeat-associated protein